MLIRERSFEMDAHVAASHCSSFKSSDGPIQFIVDSCTPVERTMLVVMNKGFRNLLLHML